MHACHSPAFNFSTHLIKNVVNFNRIAMISIQFCVVVPGISTQCVGLGDMAHQTAAYIAQQCHLERK